MTGDLDRDERIELLIDEVLGPRPEDRPFSGHAHGKVLMWQEIAVRLRAMFSRAHVLSGDGKLFNRDSCWPTLK